MGGTASSDSRIIHTRRPHNPTHQHNKMWSPLPVYTVPKTSKRWNPTKKSTSSKSPLDTSPPQTASSCNPTSKRAFQGFSDLLDPAIDGPPSPERLRAIANQMRQASISEKHQSQQTTSSGSSSVVSTSSDRPSWEHGVETLTLSRKSSQRSTTSSMPSRDRPESVQVFGKTIFNRRGKVRRESSEFGSSNSSLHSTEGPSDAPPTTSKDQHFLNSVLARRKTSKVDDDLTQRKIQISGPYNFQHLTHTEKDQAPPLNHSTRTDTPPKFSEIRYGRRPTYPSLRGIPPNGLHHSDISPESYSVQQDPSAGLHVSDGMRPEQDMSRHVLPPPVPMRSVKRNQSQEHIRMAPPRPLRSPTEATFAAPAPPPRLSSLGSMRSEGFNGMTSPTSDRPITSSGLRMPKPIVFPSQWEASAQPAPALSRPSEDVAAAFDHRFSHAITTPDNAAWPLSADATIKTLPDVPEEEEHLAFSRSRISVTSNSSSLRGSVSVPLLRQMSQSQAPTIARPPSGASETLGRFDLLAAQRALRANTDDESVHGDFSQDNWEDDIDYCYEHAAEASCDYAWERPSLDLIREEEQHSQTRDAVGVRYPSHGSGSSGLLSPPGHDDVPALSPVSQISNATNEARTPTVAVPVAANFSLPRRDSSAILVRGHNRNASHADSFKECNGFDLSPSMLIPSDYHQQMLMHERGELREEDEDLFVAPLSPMGTHFAKSSLGIHARSSASTTDSVFSSRHKSNTSTSTTLTRWTSNSTTTAAIDSWQSCNEEAESHNVSNFEKTIISPLPEFEKTRFTRNASAERHARAQSHANVLVKSSSEITMADHLKSSREPLRTRRRAKTTSRSHNRLAPVTLGLFPPMMGNRI